MHKMKFFQVAFLENKEKLLGWAVRLFRPSAARGGWSGWVTRLSSLVSVR